MHQLTMNGPDQISLHACTNIHMHTRTNTHTPFDLELQGVTDTPG